MQTGTGTRRAHDLMLKTTEGTSIFQGKGFFVDAKIDGECNIFSDTTFINKNGFWRRDFPAALLAKYVIEAMDKIVKHSVVLVCELHWGEGFAGDLYDLLSHKYDDAINCTIFDYMFEEGQDGSRDLLERREVLTRAYQSVYKSFNEMADRIRLVPSMYCNGYLEIEAAITHFIDLGYEGVVIKPKEYCFVQGGGWKYKQKSTSDLKVLSIDPYRDRIGIEDPYVSGREFCGVKVTPTVKATLKPGDIVEIQYLQKLYAKHGVITSLRNPVFIRKRDDKTEVSV